MITQKNTNECRPTHICRISAADENEVISIRITTLNRNAENVNITDIMSTYKSASPLGRVIFTSDTAWFFGQRNLTLKWLQAVSTAVPLAEYQTVVWHKSILPTESKPLI